MHSIYNFILQLFEFFVQTELILFTQMDYLSKHIILIRIPTMHDYAVLAVNKSKITYIIPVIFQSLI